MVSTVTFSDKLRWIGRCDTFGGLDCRLRDLAAVCAIVMSCLRGDVCTAVDTPEPIWDRTIASQPYDVEPFRQVQIPAWVQETLGCGYTLSTMDSQSRQAAVRHGVTISEIGFVDPFYAYYDSKLLKRRSPHVPLDRLAKEIDEYDRLGIRILAVYPPSLQSEVYELHPEWRRVADNTDEIPQVDMQQFPHGGMLCLLGPYGDFMVEVLAEILQRFPQVDAFSFDGLHFGGVCYCAHCRKKFRDETGAEIPAANLDDPAFRRYQHWADRRLEQLVQRMQTRLKGINPDVALVTWTTNAGRFGHFLSIPRNMPARMNLLLDAPDQELWLDETNRGSTIVPAFGNAYLWSVTNHRVGFSEPYIISHGNPYGKDSFPAHEIHRRMMLVLTYGAMPSIAVSQPTHLQHDLYDCMDEVQRRKPWLTHKSPERWAAIVMSDNSRNFYSRVAGQVEDRYMSHVFGMFRAGVEEHWPMTVINDWNLNDDDLSRYKVLIMPNTACLDDTQVAAIRRFVAAGGGLVASVDTSIFNEYGDPRDNFALSDVLGIDYAGLVSSTTDSRELDVNFAKSIGPDYWQQRKNVFDVRTRGDFFRQNSRLVRLLGDGPVTLKSPTVHVTFDSEGVAMVATLQVKGSTVSREFPAITTNEFGKGRVAYLAAGIDAAYYLYSYPYQRIMLDHAVRWAAAAPPPVSVRAPMCVHTTVMRQQSRNGERLIVHLFNDVNTTAAHALPNDDIPLREETIPVHDIAVTFSKDYRIREIRQQPEDHMLRFTSDGDATTVFVPRLDVHTMVVAELE